MDVEEFRLLGHRLIDWAADYRAGLAQRPVSLPIAPGSIKAGLPVEPPQTGASIAPLLDQLENLIAPGVHFQHPRYFGWFPANSLEAGVLADFVSTAFGVIGLSWQAAPALAEVEEVACDWARQMFDLPSIYQGAIHETASTATFAALVCARERSTDYAAAGSGLQGVAVSLCLYVCEHSHSSVGKAAALAGFGRDQLRSVPVTADYSMDPDALAQMVRADLAAGLRPCAVVATSGTTAVTAFDPLNAIAALASEVGMWLHVDAAMAGVGLMLPELRPLFNGIERADSLVINAHKWLGAPFDCSLFYVRDPDHLQRVMSTNPSYLSSSTDEVVRNYRDWGLPLGRRFRALKLWWVIQDQGVEGLRARLRRDLDNARWLAAEVAATPGWRVLAPVRLQTVGLRHEPAGLSGEALDRHTLDWVARLNVSGVAWVTPAMLDGRWMVRVSIGAASTERPHVAQAWAAMREAAEGA